MATVPGHLFSGTAGELQLKPHDSGTCRFAEQVTRGEPMVVTVINNMGFSQVEIPGTSRARPPSGT
jgi:hypothetical protein